MAFPSRATPASVDVHVRHLIREAQELEQLGMTEGFDPPKATTESGTDGMLSGRFSAVTVITSRSDAGTGGCTFALRQYDVGPMK